MKKNAFLFTLLFTIGIFMVNTINAGPGLIRGTRVIVYEVVSDSTIDGFTYDLLLNTDTTYYYVPVGAEVEIDSGTAYSSTGATAVIIYTRTDSDTSAVATIPDTIFTLSDNLYIPLNVAEHRTNGEQVWIDSPASVYTTGTRDYTLRLFYVKRKKIYSY
jgi:hypothetical protein